MYAQRMIMLLALSATCCAQVPPEPYSVKGDRLGESQEVWEANNPHVDVCRDDTVDSLLGSTVDPDLVYCSARMGENPTFATAPLKNITAWFYKGHLFKIEMDVWNHNWSNTIISALVDRYGSARVKRISLKNGFGVRFNKTVYVYTWENGISTIKFNDYALNVAVTLDALDKQASSGTKQARRKRTGSDM
jgi:hypothetical protein